MVVNVEQNESKQLYSWYFIVCRVVQQQVSGEAVGFTIAYTVHHWMQKWKNY